jgi:hypothetical protein
MSARDMPGAGLRWSARPRRYRPARPGAPGWHASPDARLSGHQALHAAALLEDNGWRAEAVPLSQGIAMVEVRDLARRPHPLVAILRRQGEAEVWLREHGHGLRGRVPAPPPGALR